MFDADHVPARPTQKMTRCADRDASLVRASEAYCDAELLGMKDLKEPILSLAIG